MSENQGRALRELAREQGPLMLHLRADVRKYVGTHDVVSGIVRGSEDPQDEVWAIAHSAEPGALDNASGVAVSLEIARILERLIRSGTIPRPRRTIRLVSAYECYGFFAYLERVRRLQPPLAGVCLDCVGARTDVCDGTLEWHATIPMSAGFVDRVGAVMLRAALRRHQPGYRLRQAEFQSTADTLIGDPQYGFPCPWLTSMHRRGGKGYAAYHNSADTIEILDGKGLEATAGAMAGYLHFLADMGTEQVLEIADWEAQRTVRELERGKPTPPSRTEFARTAYAETERRLRRWLWGGSRSVVMERLDAAREKVDSAAGPPRLLFPRRLPRKARFVPRRTAPISPTMENTPPAISRRIQRSGLDSWALFWADGRRSIAEIAAMAACEETGTVRGDRRSDSPARLERYVEYFEAHAELGYVELMDPTEAADRRRLVRDLKKLGVRPGMDLMVHSSLSALGPVLGGADTVVDALLDAIGPAGTLMMPSFHHRAAQVFNPLATPTTNGAIADAMWRRSAAVRSLHPTHAVAAIGPRAQEFCSHHIEVGIWAQDSPIGRLIHGGGYLLALGTTHDTSTAYHVAEVSVPCRCIDMFAFQDSLVLEDGSLARVPGLAFRSGPCPVPISRLEAALDRRGLQRRGKVARASCELCRAEDLWRIRREQLRTVCPTCSVRPQTPVDPDARPARPVKAVRGS